MRATWSDSSQWHPRAQTSPSLTSISAGGDFFREIKTRLEWKVPRALRFASKMFGGGLFIPHPLLYFICSGAPVGTPKIRDCVFSRLFDGRQKAYMRRRNVKGFKIIRKGVAQWVRGICFQCGNRFDLLNSKCISKCEGVFQTVSTESALHLYAYNCVDFCGSQV